MNPLKVISNFKKLTAGVIFMTCGSAFAVNANVCAQILLNSSVIRIEVIQDLARLKLELDLSKTQGRGTGVNLSSSLRRAYEDKILEFVKRSEGAVSEAQLHQLIRQEILKQQDPDVERAKTEGKRAEQERRAQERVNLHSFNFKYDKTIETAAALQVSPGLFGEYLAEANSYFWIKEIPKNEIITGFRLLSFNLETRTTSQLAEDISTISLMNDPSKAIMMTNTGVIRVIDLVDGKILHEVSGKLSDGRVVNRAYGDKDKVAKLAVNKSGTLLAVSEGYKLHFFNVKTGEYIGEYFHRGGFNSWVANIHFISESTVVFNSGGSLIKYDLLNPNQTLDAKVFDGVGVYGLETSKDGQTVTMLNLDEAVSIRASDMTVINRQTVFIEKGGARSRVFKRIYNTEDKILHVGSKFVPRLGVFSQADMFTPLAVFQYPTDISKREIITVSVAPDHSGAIVISIEGSSPRIDIFKNE